MVDRITFFYMTDKIPSLLMTHAMTHLKSTWAFQAFLADSKTSAQVRTVRRSPVPGGWLELSLFAVLYFPSSIAALLAPTSNSDTIGPHDSLSQMP